MGSEDIAHKEKKVKFKGSGQLKVTLSQVALQKSKRHFNLHCPDSNAGIDVKGGRKPNNR